ncbi:MAG TPA: MarR family transcriptional regulator [Pseudomonadales bacterium]|nr:MarR family transcriptional regulator [Pseudomonadales bacterium]HND13371.1 MarR family transcriptional regulator [Pseudomonadales bacterium]
MSHPELDHSCGFLIHDTARLIRRRFDLAIRDLGLTQAKWRVLATLRDNPGISQSELAERLDIERAPLGSALTWLEHAGWIRREIDSGDRRIRRVRLLDEASPTLDRMSERFRAVENHYLRGFDSDEITRMLANLRLIRDGMRGSNPSDRSQNTITPPQASTSQPDAIQAQAADATGETYIRLLFECARLLTRRFDVRLAELGFTRNQWLVINTVYRHEGLRQSAIAEATEIRPAALGRLIDSLQSDGWLERRADPRDRRANRLFLSPRARHLLAGMHKRFELLHAGLMRPLGALRQQHLAATLAWIRQRLLEQTPQTHEPRRAGAER